MLRYLAGVVSALLLVGAGVVLFRSSATTQARPVAPVPRDVAGSGEAEAPLPQASPRTREQKRFDRYDKDRNGAIAREEYMLSRRKAYTKLDVDGDGRLSFEEWAARTSGKFTGADRDRSGTLTPAEFATTAVKRSARARLRCPPQQPANEVE